MRADGVSWRAYDRFLQQYVKQMGDENLKKLPPELDPKPYRDEHDYDLMRRMQAATQDPHHPASADASLARRVGKALASGAAKAEAASVARNAAKGSKKKK